MTDLDVKTDDAIELAAMMRSGGEIIPLENRSLPVSASFTDTIVTAQNVAVKRDIQGFLIRMKALAQMAGDQYRYTFPVKSKDGSKKAVEGGSIKLANDLAREYGNCLVDVRVVDGGSDWVFYARFVDYETGFAMTRPFRQRRNQTSMKGDTERALDIAYQIGASKAIRNVVLNALQTYADIVEAEAKNSLVNSIGRKLPEWKERIKQRCIEHGFDLSRIERLSTNPIDKWVAGDVARVVSELASVIDGMATFDDIYPPEEKKVEPETKQEQKSGLEGFKDKHRAADTDPLKDETSKGETTKQTDLLNNTQTQGAK